MNRIWNAVGLSVAVLFAVCVSPSHASIFTFQQGVGGYTSAGDTYILGDNRGTEPTTTHATSNRLGIYERDPSLNNSSRGLLRFDALNGNGFTGSEIGAVSLTVTIKDNDPSGLPSTWSLYAVSAANKTWAPTSATWDNRDQTGPTPWSSGNGGVSTSGTDYVSPSLATVNINATNVAGTTLIFNFSAAGVALIADWVDNPGNNAGFMLRQDGAQGLTNRNDGIWSAEAALASDRPLLAVVVPEPGTSAILGALSLILARRRPRRES